MKMPLRLHELLQSLLQGTHENLAVFAQSNQLILGSLQRLGVGGAPARATPQEREDAFGDASSVLADKFHDFEPRSKTFAKPLANKVDLLDQLAMAEVPEEE